IDRSSRRMRVGEAAVVDRKRRLRRKVGGAQLIGDRLGAYVVGLGFVRGVVQQACGKRDCRRAEHEPTYPCRTQSSQHSATPYAPASAVPIYRGDTGLAELYGSSTAFLTAPQPFVIYGRKSSYIGC